MAVSSPQEALQAAAAGPERVRILHGAVENWAKQDLKAAQTKVKTCEKALQKQDPFVNSLSGRLGRGLYSIEKRVRRLFGRRSD